MLSEEFWVCYFIKKRPSVIVKNLVEQSQNALVKIYLAVFVIQVADIKQANYFYVAWALVDFQMVCVVLVNLSNYLLDHSFAYVELCVLIYKGQAVEQKLFRNF